MILGTSTTRIARQLAFLLCACLCFILQGCTLTQAQRKATKDFSHASSALGELAANEFQTMRNGVIELNTDRIIAAGVENDLPGLGDLDEAFDPSEVEIRIEACHVLSDYGKLLLALVEDTQEKELSAAADKFKDSVKGLSDQYRQGGLSDQQLEAVGTAVKEIGQWVVEAKKAKAVKAIVPDTDKQVKVMCRLLAMDFELISGRLADQYKTSAQSATQRIELAAVKAQTPAERTALLEMYQACDWHKQRSKSVSLKIAEAVSKVSKAHENLSKVLIDRTGAIERADIEDYRQRVKRVVDAVRLFSTSEAERE